MIIKTICDIIITILGALLSPFSFVTNIFGNFFEDEGFVSLLKMLSFFIDREIIIFIISTFLFWTGLFIIKPLVSFIVKKIQN